MAGASTTRALPVLMYHSVSSVDRGRLRDLAVPPRVLRAHLEALVNAGYRLVGQSEALDALAAGDSRPLVALTFDDGYANFLDALPILADLGATATLYLAVGHLGKPAPWLGEHAEAFGPLLDWAQSREVAAAGIEIGNHGLVHHPLDVLPPDRLDGEVWDSRDLLEQRLGRRVRSFCYPHGYHDRRVRTAVVRAGHDNACEIGRRLHRAGGSRLAVPRLQPTPDHGGADLCRLVRAGEAGLTPVAKRLAQPGWRLTRRAALRVFHTNLT